MLTGRATWRGFAEDGSSGGQEERIERNRESAPLRGTFVFPICRSDGLLVALHQMLERTDMYAMLATRMLRLLIAT